ncbi:hypothetical protein BY458DRAFT_512365 [Sporodiniella umbellata]|nr:hypothetical protein BY458DRAFT_512365 [Sporodiniella umbellata]
MSKLPSLKEVLSRKSQPPVCLYNYYIVLRDRLAIEPWLDFWLDVSQATALHKRYIKHRQTPDLWPHLVMPSKKPRMVPTEEEMIATVDRIYLKYIAPSAEKEIFMLPEAIRHAIGNQLAQDKAAREDPAIYLEAQKHVYNQLESTFHLFIRYKVFMNLTLPQQIGRLVLGFLSLWAGFTLEFCLIFLDIQPCWPGCLLFC